VIPASRRMLAIGIVVILPIEVIDILLLAVAKPF
jgi:hypothetical protein